MLLGEPMDERLHARLRGRKPHLIPFASIGAWLCIGLGYCRWGLSAKHAFTGWLESVTFPTGYEQ